MYFSQIEKINSPNSSMRKSPFIDTVVIHATAGKFESSVFWLCNPKSGVSSHFVIRKDGYVVQLIDDTLKAWHAGQSFWNGKPNVNEFSIGIEIENKNDGLDPYTDDQMETCAKLICDLMTIYDRISPENIVGHDQIAPGRKTDPNINFPWVKLGSLIERFRHGQ